MMPRSCKYVIINKLMSFIGSTTTVFKRWMRKGRMPAKHGKKDYIKGTGGGSMGQFIKGIII